MQRLLSPPAGFSSAESSLHRCLGPLSPKHLPFLETLALSAIVNFSDTRLSLDLSADIAVHELPVDTSTLHLQAVLDSLELVLSLAGRNVLLIGTPKNSFDALLIACLRRVQGWTMLAILSEFRCNCTARSFDMEQFIEHFDPSLLSYQPNATLPEYLQIYREAKVK